MEDPLLRQILEGVNDVKANLMVIEAQITDLKSDRDDHESRLRRVEARTDESRRIDALETRVTQHDAGFTKQGERVGAVEQQMMNADKALDRLATPKIHPIAYISAGLSAVSIVVVALLAIAGMK